MGVKSITSLAVVGLCFGLIASINCTQALYLGVFSVNPISCIREFRLGESCIDFSGGESISNCFFPDALAICFVLIGMGLPSAVAKVACLFLIDFLVSLIGSPVLVFSLNMGCCGACRFSMSKKRRHVTVLRADLYAT